MARAPLVTGLSPIEGPPGTRLTIRGDNLGNNPNDLIGLQICGCDCFLSAEWKSPHKIIARSGPGKGKGDIIVTTKSGGHGTATVQFRGYHETIGPTKESAVWVEEAPLLLFWGRRSLSPSSYQHEDPLGLSVEGNDKKFPEDDLHDFFPNSSGDIAADNFSAGWFLLENHHATSFNDLKAGLSFLRRKVEGQKEGQLSFLKANVGSVMDQIDTLKLLKDKFHQDKQVYGSEPVLKLEKAIKESVHEANKLFEDVLARKDRADATRSALSVLTRFRFLFCLPCAIDRYIKRGDYDIIINDYVRVKNLFKKTDVPVFKKALAEIEKRVLSLRQMLHAKLQYMPVSVEEQKRIIRYLVNLEAEGEPAWDAISSHSTYITKKIKQCYTEYRSAENSIAEELGKSKSTYLGSKYSKYTTVQDSQIMVPQSVLFVDEICDILSTAFPDLWKLGQAYFSGELKVKVETGRQTNFKHIVLTLMNIFCDTVRSALLPHTYDKNTDRQEFGGWQPLETDIIASWLPHCLRYVRSTYSIFIRLDLPSDALDIILKLILDLRLYCITVLFKQAIDQIRGLEKKENWKIEFCGGHSGITQLPLNFEKILQDVVLQVRESVLISEQREGPLFDSHVAQAELDKQVNILLQSFWSTLNNLAYQNKNPDDDDHSPVVSQLIGSPVIYRGSEKLNSIPIWERRLLTTLSNCHYTNSVILLRISDLFLKNGYPVPKAAIEYTKNSLDTLDKSILETYLEQKSDPLVGTIEPSMYLGKFDWDTSLKPSDIKPYAKECMNNLIGVHTEVHSVSPALVEKVLTEVVEIVAEELSRLMSCVKKFSHFGILQARADILALQETLRFYTTPKAKIFFEEALDAIPNINAEDSKIIECILKQFRIRMHLQILCFNTLCHSNSPAK